MQAGAFAPETTLDAAHHSLDPHQRGEVKRNTEMPGPNTQLCVSDKRATEKEPDPHSSPGTANGIACHHWQCPLTLRTLLSGGDSAQSINEPQKLARGQGTGE